MQKSSSFGRCKSILEHFLHPLLWSPTWVILSDEQVVSLWGSQAGSTVDIYKNCISGWLPLFPISWRCYRFFHTRWPTRRLSFDSWNHLWQLRTLFQLSTSCFFFLFYLVVWLFLFFTPMYATFLQQKGSGISDGYGVKWKLQIHLCYLQLIISAINF